MSEWVWQNFLYPGPPLPGTMSERKKYEDFVQELRFTSNLSGKWQFVAGGYFSVLHGCIPWAGCYPPAVMPGFAAEFGQPALVEPTNPDNIFGTTYNTNIQEPALFGETSYQFTDALRATLGVRLYQVRTRAGGFQDGTATGGGAPLVDPEITITERGANPKLQVQYRLNPTDMLYALIAKGFRPGGLVPSVPVTGANSCATYLAQVGITAEQARHYGADSLWNYEVGAKTGWLDNHLTLDASGFYIHWKNIQQQIPLPCGFQYRANAGAAVSKGFEFELHARPFDGLDFTVSTGYNNARITETGAGSPQNAGDRVLQVPDWTGSAALTYTLGLGASRNAVFTIDDGYVGTSRSANNDPFNPRLRPSYDLVDARIALEWNAQEIALVGRNLRNTHANLADNRSIVAEVTGRPRIVTNAPRTIGVEFRTEF